MPAPARNQDLHGNAPDEASRALLIIDMIGEFEFEGADALFPRALDAAHAIAALKRRAKQARVPVIYVNDNYGKWQSDFRKLLEHCLHQNVRGRAIAELLAPDEDDYFVLKPKHSGFHGTTLEVLLAYLKANTLILCGVAGNLCVLFTAMEAFIRDYRLAVPSDCVASETEADHRAALEYLAKFLKADTRPSTATEFPA